MRHANRLVTSGRSPRPVSSQWEVLEDRRLYSGSPYLHPTIDYGYGRTEQHVPLKQVSTKPVISTKPAIHRMPVHHKPAKPPGVSSQPPGDPTPAPAPTPTPAPVPPAPVPPPPVPPPPPPPPPVTIDPGPPVTTQPPPASPPPTTTPPPPPVSPGPTVPPTGPHIPPADHGTTTPPVSGTWSEIWSDEFSGTSLNPVWHTAQYWDKTTTVVGQGELEAYNAAADIVSNGALHITATPNTSYGAQYLSGLVMTGGIQGDSSQPTFNFKYGYMEVRAKLPAGQGLWPAIWLMPASYQDGNGEIDVMENLGNDMTTAYGTVHVHGSQQQHTWTGADLSAGWHTFGIDWEPDHITWYIDGKAYGTTPNTSLIPQEAMYPIMNLAVGGTWGGNPDASTSFPATMDIDYIRVWQKTA